MIKTLRIFSVLLIVSVLSACNDFESILGGGNTAELTAEIYELVDIEDYYEALLVLEVYPDNQMIGTQTKSEYVQEVLSYLVAEVYVYYWDARSISDLNAIEDEIRYVFNNLSDYEKYIIAYDMIDLQWHQSDFDLNELFIENFVKTLLPDDYEELKLSNDEMRLSSEIPTASDLAKYLEPKSAIVYVYDGSVQISIGSAFFINNRGLLITNYHVVEGGNKLQIITGDGRTHDVSVLLYDEIRDLALLKAPIRDNDFVTLSNSYFVQSGDPIYTYGSPLGNSNTITAGLVSKNISIVDAQEFIQLSAPISPGSSGGMLVNQFGDVIGVITAYMFNGQNMNLAIPINRAIELIHQVDSSIELVNGGNNHIKDITNVTIRKIHQYIYEETDNDTLYGFLDTNGDYVYGIINYNDGSYFEGELGANRLGNGLVAYFTDSYSYYGESRNGLEEGNGTAIYQDGGFYVGEFRNGLFHGRGNYFWGSDDLTQFGHVYIGDWVDDNRTGFGTYLWPDGSIYQGEFIEGSRNGTGEYFGYDGVYYKGGYIDDLLNGEGELYSEDGIYIGTFLNGLYHGYGELDFENGIIHKGWFLSGAPSGEGIRYFDNGYFVATWTDWLDASGTYFFNTGSSEFFNLIDGVWN
jgi:S1-C subfamily serine protease